MLPHRIGPHGEPVCCLRCLATAAAPLPSYLANGAAAWSSPPPCPHSNFLVSAAKWGRTGSRRPQPGSKHNFGRYQWGLKTPEVGGCSSQKCHRKTRCGLCSPSRGHSSISVHQYPNCSQKLTRNRFQRDAASCMYVISKANCSEPSRSSPLKVVGLPLVILGCVWLVGPSSGHFRQQTSC